MKLIFDQLFGSLFSSRNETFTSLGFFVEEFILNKVSIYPIKIFRIHNITYGKKSSKFEDNHNSNINSKRQIPFFVCDSKNFSCSKKIIKIKKNLNFS